MHKISHQTTNNILFRQITRFLLLIILILAISAGYYHQLYILENKKYKKIEDQFVRIRSQLGVDQTQQLIDNSYLPTGPFN